MYEEGKSVTQDYEKSAEWYKKAAEQNFVEAQFKLGLMYDLGKGAKQDDEKAKYWYRKAVENGHEGAKIALNVLEFAEQDKKSQTSTASTQPKPQTQPSASSLSEPRNFNEAQGIAAAFLASVEDIAEKLMKTESYNTQDINSNENNGDETLYMRSWYDDRYFMFCYYANRPRHVAAFRTYSPEHVFAGEIKVGSSFSEIRDLFGDFSEWNAEDNTLTVNEGTTEANIHITDGRVDYIEYNIYSRSTRTKCQIFCVCTGAIFTARSLRQTAG